MGGGERARPWQSALEWYQGYAAYERRAVPRPITLWTLEPLDETSAPKNGIQLNRQGAGV